MTMYTVSFGAWDYVVLALMLASSMGIGIYYAVNSRNQTTSEYLVAGRSMTFLPVAFSLIVTFQSSIMMLGTPAESYVYGISWMLAEVGNFFGGILEIILALTFLKRLDLSTPFEYFERRFHSRGLRVMANVMSCVSDLLYSSVVLYGQGVALQTVTGFSIYGSIILTATTAVIYTAIGGLRAVIWSDVLQSIIMVIGMLAVSIKGTIDAGGAREVWTRAYQSGRMEFSLSPDPTVRHTVWNLLFGRFLSGFGFLIAPATLQRISSTKSLKHSRRALFMAMPGFSVLKCMALAEGIVAYGYYAYKRCDPLASHQIENPNQIIPFMIMDVFRYLPGMPGLFLAALSSASLSTLSSLLSAVSVITLYDIIKPRFPNMSGFRELLIAKATVVVFGAVTCFLAVIFSLASSKTLNQIVYTVGAIGGYQIVGLFYLGALFSFVNTKGAITGFITGIVLLGWLVIGSTFFDSGSSTPYYPLGSTDQCPAFNDTSVLFNITTISPTTLTYSTDSISTSPTIATSAKPGVSLFYSLSYTLFSSFAVVVVLLVGVIASLVTGGIKNHVDPELLIHMEDIQCCGPPRRTNRNVNISGNHDINLTSAEQVLMADKSNAYISKVEPEDSTNAYVQLQHLSLSMI